MALGRPGLEPCVPLEVRFRVVIDQWSRAEQIFQAKAPSQASFTSHIKFKECRGRFTKLFTCFFIFLFRVLLFNLGPQFPFSPALTCSRPPSVSHSPSCQHHTSYLTSKFTLFATLTIRGFKQL